MKNNHKLILEIARSEYGYIVGNEAIAATHEYLIIALFKFIKKILWKK